MIFSQFILEFAKRVENKAKLTAREFTQAMRGAIEATYEALEKPREGTILTVIKEAALEAERARRKTDNLVEVLERALERARKALEETPKYLSELKKAGVVDAGGLGFVLFLEGMLDYLKDGKLEVPGEVGVEIDDKHREAEYRGEHRYCTEAIVEGEGLESKKLRKILAALGGSLVVIGAGKLFHIHIHTNWPHRVLELLRQRGRILKEKVDDLFAMAKLEEQKVAVIVDSTCDLPPELLREKRITVVPVKVIADGVSYDDGIDISRERVLHLLRSGNAFLTTSQPSPNDFMRAFEDTSMWAKALLVITLSSALSGTIRSAEIAARAFDRVPVRIVDSKSTSLGLGLLALHAAEKAQEGWELKELAEYVESLVPQIHFFFTLDTFKYVIKSGRVSKLQGKLADFLGVRPILTLDSEGRIAKYSKVLGKRKVLPKIKEALRKVIKPGRLYDFGIAHLDVPEIAGELEEYIAENFRARLILKSTLTPALGLHAGPKSWGVFAIPVERGE